MALVPAASAQRFNGGTISGALTIATTDPTLEMLVMNPPVGLKANSDSIIDVSDEAGQNVLFLDGFGTLSVHSQSTGGGAVLAATGAVGGVAPLQTWTPDANQSQAAQVSPAGDFSTRNLKTGALATVALVSGTAHAIDSTADRYLVVPVTLNPTAGAAATCTVALAPQDGTFSTVGVATAPAGVALDGTIQLVSLLVPGAWSVKLTVVNATLGTGTFY